MRSIPSLIAFFGFILNSKSFRFGSFRLRFRPFIGGPSWLKLHVSISTKLYSDLEMDFIPLNSTDATTLQQLLRGNSVPGTIRVLSNINSINKPDYISNVPSVIAYLNNNFNTNLNIFNNNCYHFAYYFYNTIEDIEAGRIILD
jgi:hypothetical protein